MSAVTINDRVLAVLPKLERADLEHVAQLLLDEVGYLNQHNPAGDEHLGKFPCTGRTYHSCSFEIRHAEWCADAEEGAEGPDGRGRACPKPCHEGPPEPWCEVNGFDCPTCALVTELTRVADENEPKEARNGA